MAIPRPISTLKWGGGVPRLSQLNLIEIQPYIPVGLLFEMFRAVPRCSVVSPGIWEKGRSPSETLNGKSRIDGDIAGAFVSVRHCQTCFIPRAAGSLFDSRSYLHANVRSRAGV